MSEPNNTQPVSLLPFQQENVASNQQNVPIPYLGGERLMALKWIQPALGEMTQQATGSGKKG
ncbi:MAG TPA: hypothetical protein VGG34_01525 [Opitutaceae bacterium]|jgi:hypothetical protein